MKLAAETIEGPALAFQSIDDVHGGDSLPLGVLSVSDGIANDVLEEHLEDTAIETRDLLKALLLKNLRRY